MWRDNKTVGSNDILDEAITRDKIAREAVTAQKTNFGGLKIWAGVTDAYEAPDGGAWTAATEILIRVRACATFDAIISIDGGTTDSFYAPVGGADLQWFRVPAGGVIQAKAAAAGSNPTGLVIEWAT
ncbi:MAG TPA: hypothetical protein VFH53_10170 [Phycisphaerae bacterium]|nr:hypothetical protein [Phycisphaerae bacterium]